MSNFAEQLKTAGKVGHGLYGAALLGTTAALVTAPTGAILGAGGGAIRHAFRGKSQEKTSQETLMSESLAEQLKTAGVLGGAAGGAAAGAIIENFLRENPHLIDWAGEGLSKKIPKGLASAGAIGGGLAEHMAGRTSRKNG